MENEILVSVICNTYNHENYIAEAIESFLMQKTDFKYEILIHDDASTDKTAEIIKAYEEKYPDIIKPIFQTENQYSKGVRVDLLNQERAVGKYYALCEGDDYWSDSYKLQKQIDYLEKTPNCSVCAHSALMIDGKSKKIINKLQPSNQSIEFTVEEMIMGGGGFLPTNSLVYRKSIGDIHPDFYYKSTYTFSDYQLILMLSLAGNVYYINEAMSVYRYNVPGSWSSRNLYDTEKISRHIKDVNSMLDEVNEYTKYEYDNEIQKTKRKNEFDLLISQGNLKEARSNIFINYYKSLSFKSKISINLKYYTPSLHKTLYLMREKILYGRN